MHGSAEGPDERLRLADRERRIEQVLDALHRRARARTVPPGLAESINDFSRELAQVRGRLRTSA
jgi:hypothetical protein